MDGASSSTAVSNMARSKLSLKRKRADGGSKSATGQPSKRVLLAPKLKDEVISKLNRTKNEGPKAENENEVSSNGAAITATEDSRSEKSKLDLPQQDTTGMGDLFFCHICQKNLTSFNLTRRQQHLNWCCDSVGGGGGGEVKGDSSNTPELEQLSCMLCQKKFGDKQARISHMKSCAKQKGISTAELLSRVKGDPGPRSLDGKKQTLLKRTLRSSEDGDFKEPLPSLAVRRTTRKKKGASVEQGLFQEIEYEQLQLGLALSASLEDPAPGSSREVVGGAGGAGPEGVPGTGVVGKRKAKARGRKRAKLNMDALPLLTVSTQQSRDIIASRAEKLLSPQLTGGVSSQEEEDGEEEEIPCTPAFGSSSLAGGVAPAPSAMLAVGVAMGSCDEPGGMAEGSCGRMLEAEDDLQEVDQVQDDYKEEARSDGGPQEVENFDEGLTVFSSEEGTGGLLPGDVGSEVSFARELEGMAYPTLWELGACDLTSEEGVRDFYVPSLAPIITPIKYNPLTCKRCDSEVCVLNFALSQSSGIETKPETVLPAADSHREDQVSSLLTDLGSLLDSPLLSDLTVLASGGARVRAHGCILAARCPGFRRAVLAAPALVRTFALDLSAFSPEAVLGYLRGVYTASADSAAFDERTRNEVEAISSKMSSDEISVSITHRYTIPETPSMSGHQRDHSPLPLPATPSPPTEDAPPTPRTNSSSSSVISCSMLGACPGPRGTEPEPTVIGSKCGSPVSSKGEVVVSSKSCSPSVTLCEGEGEGVVCSEVSSPTVSCGESVVTDGRASSVIRVSGDSGSDAEVVVDDGLSSGTKTSSSLAEEEEEEEEEGGDLVLISPDLGEAGEVTMVSCLPAVNGEEEEEGEVVVDANSDLSSNDAMEVVDLSMSPVLFAGVDSDSDAGGEVVNVSPSALDPLTLRHGSDWPAQHKLPSTELEDDVSGSEVGGAASPCELPEEEHSCSWQSAGKYDAIFEELIQVESPPTPPSPRPQTVGSTSSPPPMPLSPHPPNDSAPTPAASSVAAPPPTFTSHLAFITPSSTRGVTTLQSADDITPTPKYHQMATPRLKEQCARYGVKALPKRKMIAKLREIYNYTHPLVGEDGSIVPERDVPTEELAGGRLKDSDCIHQVKAAITSDQQLYEDILLYKPLEMSHIQAKLKSAGLSLPRDKLADILDWMCITFVEPRNRNSKK